MNNQWSYICERGYEKHKELCNMNASAPVCAFCKLGLYAHERGVVAQESLGVQLGREEISGDRIRMSR